MSLFSSLRKQQIQELGWVSAPSPPPPRGLNGERLMKRRMSRGESLVQSRSSRKWLSETMRSVQDQVERQGTPIETSCISEKFEDSFI